MKAVIQTVKDASCTVDGVVISEMDEGLLVYFGLDVDDTPDDLKPFLDKILRLRIYRGEDDRKMNYSIRDKSDKVMLISQFTLLGDLKRGNRPSFDRAMKGETAEELYEKALSILEEEGVTVSRGVFGAHMEIRYMNDGPETFILEK